MLQLLQTHGNADNLGNKAASDYITKDRIAILTGTLKTPAANSGSLTGDVEINYPNRVYAKQLHDN